MREKANPDWSEIWCHSIGTRKLMLQEEKNDIQGTWRLPKSRWKFNSLESPSIGCSHFIS
jgi:hypothetical protein